MFVYNNQMWSINLASGKPRRELRFDFPIAHLAEGVFRPNCTLWPLGFFVRARSVKSVDARIVGPLRDDDPGGKGKWWRQSFGVYR